MIIRNTYILFIATIVMALLFMQSAVAIEQTNLKETKITTMTYGDWHVRCEVNNGEDKSCVMTQKIVSQPNGQELIQANIAKTDKGTLMTIIFPLGVYLPSGVILQIDDFDPVTYNILFCTHDGCFVNEVLDKNTLNLLRKKNGATLKLRAGPEREEVTIPFSITGFLDAYKKI